MKKESIRKEKDIFLICFHMLYCLSLIPSQNLREKPNSEPCKRSKMDSFSEYD